MRRIFSTVRAPQLPALTVESFAMRATVRPPIFPRPVTTPSAGRSGSATLAKVPSSMKEPGSRSRAMRSLANSFPVSAFLAWYFGAPPSRIRARRARRVSSAGMRRGGLPRGVPRLSGVPTVEVQATHSPQEGAHMAFSDIVGGFTKSYLYTNLARDGVKLWNRLGDLDLMDFDKERLLRKVGVVPYSPGSRTASDITLFLLGGLVGAVVGLALAPKAGAELRSDVRERAMNLFDQVKHKAQDVERATA